MDLSSGERTAVEMNLGTYKSGYHDSAYPYAQHLAAARARLTTLPHDISGKLNWTSWPLGTNTHLSWRATPAAPRPVCRGPNIQLPPPIALQQNALLINQHPLFGPMTGLQADLRTAGIYRHMTGPADLTTGDYSLTPLILWCPDMETPNLAQVRRHDPDLDLPQRYSSMPRFCVK